MATSEAARRRRALAAVSRILPEVDARAQAVLGRLEGVAFLARLDHHLLDIYEPLDELYGHGSTSVDALFQRLVMLALEAAGQRPVELRELDRRREVDQHWYQRARMIGYVCYTDRFCDSLTKIPERLDYLQELGVTYLHLMPLLKPREGANDGGYAVQDYRAIDPRVGTMQDLEAVAAALRDRGMSLCVDFVLNHTAKEHEWAQGWLAGEERYADFFMAFPDRSMPDAYERTLPEVFPDQAPGSFTWFDEVNGGAGGWVWTTFFSYQWDLNYANPNVFAAMLETIMWLANRGVEIFRMDAVPFMWKRLGTNCQNQPEVHTLMQGMRALVTLAAPATVFKAEAIVSPDDLVPYLGGHERYRPECELAYHNQLMVMLWSSLATKDARLAARALRRMKTIPTRASWVTYVRCHDDIGWAISDQDAASLGWNAWQHQRFLSAYFAGAFPGSYARGALFQDNPATGDSRMSGSTASLCGIEQALADGDQQALDRGIRRLVMMYSVAYSYGGVPLLYMGDELALRNDHSYLQDPALAPDNRWMHRPRMDWAAAERRNQPTTLEGKVFGWLQRLANARRDTLALRAGGELAVQEFDDPHVLGWRRRHPRSGLFVGLANFAEHDASVPLAALHPFGHDAAGGLQLLLSSDGLLDIRDGRLFMRALSFVWLVEP
jgi:amylosucrase